MSAIFIFDVTIYSRRWGFYWLLVLLSILGFGAGSVSNFSLGDDILKNSPYQLSYVTGLLSLTTIFFSTAMASQLIFREADARFDSLIFSLPIKRTHFVFGRFLALITLTILYLLLFTINFFIAQSFKYTSEKLIDFDASSYVFAFLMFGFVNTLFTTSVVSFIGWFSKNKLLVYVGGLLLYIAYMAALLYSGSPLMAQSMPQSAHARTIAAFADPFGLSAFFYQTSGWSVLQRNTQLISLNGVFLINRVIVLLISTGLLIVSATRSSFRLNSNTGNARNTHGLDKITPIGAYRPVKTTYGFKAHWLAFFSLVKIDLTYTFKSIAFVMTALGMLFYVGMEMYAAIEKGSRIPQQYASSGLMVQTVIQSFHPLCLIAVLYYVQEIFWRSKNTNFYLIEHSTIHVKAGFYAKWASLSLIILLFSGFMILEGIVFQLIFKYPTIEWLVYASVFLFNAMPLIVLSGALLLIQKVVNQRASGLAATALFALLLATSLGKTVVSFPLLKFFQPLSNDYSDMNGFGIYQNAFVWRLIFGMTVVIILMIIVAVSKKNLKKWKPTSVFVLLWIIAIYSGEKSMNGYTVKDKATTLLAQARYEQQYRKFQNFLQPTVTDVQTTIDLYPDKNAYHITGTYALENKTHQPIHQILVNFVDDFTIHQAVLISGNETKSIKKQYEVISLNQPLLPTHKAHFSFDMSYDWKAVNGHASFNAMVENGSFMRISRYYPTFGYLADNEIQGETVRQQYHLGIATSITAFDAPRSKNDDFISLDMIVSTSGQQTAIGIGELIRQWPSDNRNYFHYKTTTSVPFRFAISSANYAIRKEAYQGKSFEIYYHPAHYENVDYLLENAKRTIDYCEANFGAYPFKTIRFAEVSAFTKGFAATAYPETIFMTENRTFHANIKADKQQDVINELAGHELSHAWWGNSQISPDDRAGAALMTETLAMYTEMMLIKKMYGKQKLIEHVKTYLEMYQNERGFTQEQPLYRLLPDNTLLSYSKGAVVMYLLSEMIGEDQVNRALRNFLQKYKYPHPKPTSTDLLQEIYRVSNEEAYPAINELFKEVKEIKETDLYDK